MFGLIKPFVPELKVKESEYYRAAYCGLCRCMGKNTSRLARLALSYDWVFLFLVRSCIFEEAVSATKIRCFMNPLKKRNAISPTDQLNFTSAVASYLIWHNVIDDLNDSRAWDKVKAYLAYPLAKRIKKKAPKMDDMQHFISQQLADIRQMEEEKCPSADKVADSFGKIMAYICAYGVDDELKRQAAYEVGFHTGRFIYIADAIKDYEDDKKTGSYNPFIYQNTDPYEKSDILYRALCMESEKTYSGVLLLSNGTGGSICENIAQLGMIHVATEICSKHNPKG